MIATRIPAVRAEGVEIGIAPDGVRRQVFAKRSRICRRPLRDIGVTYVTGIDKKGLGAEGFERTTEVLLTTDISRNRPYRVVVFT
jgi:hypothetical protein